MIGGWAVRHTLNKKFKAVTGSEYPGSRDIDLGFHLDIKWNPSQFKVSALGKAIKQMESMGFESESFRFVKRYHLWEERELTAEEERSLPQYDTFNLYIDVLVDTNDLGRFKVAGFNVLEEPLLARVFAGTDYVKTRLAGVEVMMPTPSLLIEMKVKSFPDRTQDDKKTKDLMDLCGLIQYSGTKLPVLSKNASKRFEQAVKKIKEEEWKSIAGSLGVSTSSAKRIARSISQ